MSPAPSLAWPDILLVLVMAIISAITVAGNLVVMLSFVLDRQIRQPSNFFIFSLAVSDLVIGLEGIPVYTYFLVNGQRWPFGAFLCDLWLSVDYACCLASIYTVLGITADRYMSVKFPAAYRNWRTQRRVLLIIAGIWLIPSVLFSVSIFGYGWFSGKGRILREDECYVQFMTNAYLNMGMYISYYWSTLVLMLYLYYGIYSAAKQLARKSDQKQKRLAILSEMRAQEQGNNPPKNDNKGAAAAAVAAQQNEPPSVYPSEANATLEGDSLDSRPVRNSTARLWQNGRLMSLRSILSGDDRLTGGGKRGTGVAHTEANKPPEQTQRSSTLTTAANNLSSSEAKDTESQRQEERDTLADTQKADGEPEIEMSAQARQMDEERSRLEGAFSPEKLSSCGEDNYCFPFIDESSNSSVEEAHQKEDLQQQCQQQTAVAPINGRSAEVRNNNAGGEEEEHRGLGALFRASRLPDQSHSALSSCCSRGLSSQQLLPQSCNTTIDFALEPPCVNASASDEQQTEDNSNNEQQQHPHMSAAAPQSTIARLDVQVERQFRGEQRLAGMRRWLLAMGRWERITLKGGGRRKAPSSANSRAPPGARERKTAAQQQLRKMSKSSQSRSENRARKALRTITVILGTFILFWTPFYVLATVYGFCERCTNSAGFQALYTISYYLCYMNSPINPLCYAMANQQFKRAFKRILRGDLRRS